MGFATVGLVHAWFFLNFAVHNSANLEWRTLGVVFLLFVAAWPSPRPCSSPSLGSSARPT